MLGHASKYLSGHAALVVLQLVSIPVFTHLLAPADYGLFQIFNSYISIGTVLITLNAASSVTRRELEIEKGDTSFLGSVLLLIISTVIFTAACVLPFADRVSGVLGITPALVFLLVFAILSSAAFQVFNSFCIARKESAVYSVVSIVRGYGGALFSIAITLVLVQNLYLGPAWGTTVASCMVSVWVVRKLSRHASLAPTLEHFRYMVMFSVPLMFYSIGNVILGQLDRVMVNGMIGAAEAGIYSLAYNVGLLLDVVSSALHAALVPFWFKHLNAGERMQADNLGDFNFRLTLVFALGLIFFSKELLTIIAADAFHAAFDLLPVIVVGYVFNSVYKIYLREVSYSKRMWHVSLVAVIGAIFNWGANYYFLPIYGYRAAAYTTLASFFLMGLIAWFVVRHVLNIMAFPVRRLIGPFLVFGLGLVTYYGIEQTEIGLVGLSILKALLLLAFVCLFLAKWIFGKRWLTV